MKIKAALFASALLLAASSAMAGSVSGPRLIWLNLAKDPAAIDTRMTAFFDSEEERCWGPGMLVFMRTKPEKITAGLVQRAVVQGERAAIKELNGLLKLRFGEANDGFDGIVVYAESPNQRVYSLTRGRQKVTSVAIKSLKEDDELLESAFCEVIPPIVRQP